MAVEIYNSGRINLWLIFSCAIFSMGSIGWGYVYTLSWCLGFPSWLLA